MQSQAALSAAEVITRTHAHTHARTHTHTQAAESRLPPPFLMGGEFSFIEAETPFTRIQIEYDIKKVFRSHETAWERWRRCSTYDGPVSGAVLPHKTAQKCWRRCSTYAGPVSGAVLPHQTARKRWGRCSTYAGPVSGAVLSPQNTPKASKKTPEHGCHGCPSVYAPRWM